MSTCRKRKSGDVDDGNDIAAKKPTRLGASSDKGICTSMHTVLSMCVLRQPSIYDAQAQNGGCVLQVQASDVFARVAGRFKNEESRGIVASTSSAHRAVDPMLTSCMICEEERLNLDIGCGHKICTECAKSYVDFRSKSCSTTGTITCPISSRCHAQFSPDVVRDLLTPQAWALYERRVAARAAVFYGSVHECRCGSFFQLTDSTVAQADTRKSTRKHFASKGGDAGGWGAFSDSETQSIKCWPISSYWCSKCALALCWGCHRKSHAPASCDMVTAWEVGDLTFADVCNVNCCCIYFHSF